MLNNVDKQFCQRFFLHSALDTRGLLSDRLPPGFQISVRYHSPKDHKNKSVQKYPELKSILVRSCPCCSAEHIKNAEMETKDSVLNLIE